MTLNTTKPMSYGRINEMRLQLLKAQLLSPSRNVRLVLRPTAAVIYGLHWVGRVFECSCSYPRVLKHVFRVTVTRCCEAHFQSHVAPDFLPRHVGALAIG